MGGESFAIYDGGVTVPWHSYRAKLFNRFKAGCLPRQKVNRGKTLMNQRLSTRKDRERNGKGDGYLCMAQIRQGVI
jgi:hypothetical protein